MIKNAWLVPLLGLLACSPGVKPSTQGGGNSGAGATGGGGSGGAGATGGSGGDGAAMTGGGGTAPCADSCFGALCAGTSTCPGGVGEAQLAALLECACSPNFCGDFCGESCGDIETWFVDAATCCGTGTCGGALESPCGDCMFGSNGGSLCSAPFDACE